MCGEEGRGAGDDDRREKDWAGKVGFNYGGIYTSADAYKLYEYQTTMVNFSRLRKTVNSKPSQNFNLSTNENQNRHLN